MSRKISNASLKRQIAREGKRWNLFPVEIHGVVCVAEDIPVILPAGSGTFYVDRLRREITAISMEYPFSSLLRNRKHTHERDYYARIEMVHERRQAELAREKAETRDEFTDDAKRLNRIQIYHRMPTGAP